MTCFRRSYPSFISFFMILIFSLSISTLLAAQTPIPPLPPNPIYPANDTLSVPSSFTVLWNSGLDASRTNPLWPVTYSIYYKFWPYGGTEPAAYTLFGSALQCNPDSTGVCTMPVTGITVGNYRWYVVANMDISAYTGVPNSILSTQSSAAFFTEGNEPLSMIPAPLPPDPVFPDDGLLNVPSSFILRWSNGLNALRSNPQWPVTYAIYYKVWSSGGTEPASYTLFASGLPCQPDSTGVCTRFVPSIDVGNYRWYVVANMDVSISTGVADSVLSTQGSPAFFTRGSETIPPVQSPPNKNVTVPPQSSDGEVTIDVAPPPPPLTTVYRIFFLHLAHLDQLADQDQANADVDMANGWRTYDQTAAGLTDSEGQILKQVAYSCNDQLKALDDTIQAQLTSFRTQYPNGQFLSVAAPSELSQSFQQKEDTISSCIVQLQTGLGDASFQKLNTYVQASFGINVQVPVPGPRPTPTPLPISSPTVDPPPSDPPTNTGTNAVPAVNVYSAIVLNSSPQGGQSVIECASDMDAVTYSYYNGLYTYCHLYVDNNDTGANPCPPVDSYHNYCSAYFPAQPGHVYRAVGLHALAMYQVQGSTASCYWADPLQYRLDSTPIGGENDTVTAGRGLYNCWGDNTGNTLELEYTVSNWAAVIAITPATKTLFPGETQTFSANIPVNWTLFKGPGSIGASTGTYQAPATIDTQQQAVIQGCNTANPNNCGTATITLSPVTLTISTTVNQELIQGEQAPLTVTFTPSSFDPTKTIDWSLDPNLGIVSNNVYFPPTNDKIPSGLTTVTITGKSHKNPAIFATVTVTVAHIDFLSVVPVRSAIFSGETTTLSAISSPPLPSPHDVSWPPPDVGTIKPLPQTNAAEYTAPVTTKEQTVSIKANMGGVPGETKPPLTIVPFVNVGSVTPSTLNAGETIAITIKGTGFGLRPQVKFSDLAGLTDLGIVFTQDPTLADPDTMITGTVVVPQTAPGGLIIVSVANTSSVITPPPGEINTVSIKAVQISVTLFPTSATVQVGQSATFTPTVSCKTASGLTCPNLLAQTVNCFLKPLVGSVTQGAACVYTATPPISSQQVLQVVACSTTTPTACNVACTSPTCGFASVTVPPVNVTVSPKNITLYGGQTQQFTFTVSNNPDTHVTWSIIPDSQAPANTPAGTVDQNGKYTAPNPIPQAETIKVHVCSTADSSRCDDAPVNLVPLIVNPSTVILKASQAKIFAATTNGITTLVDWSIDPNVAAAGSIAPDGTYTAPSALSTVFKTTVIATSKETASRGAKGTALVSLAAACYPRCRAVSHVSPSVVGISYTGSVLDPTVEIPQGFIYAGNLPPNLNFAADTGAISGVPVQPPAVYGFSATPYYADGDGGTQLYAFPVCQSTTVPPINVGPILMNGYSSIQYVPGVNPPGTFVYSTAGPLPPGMVLDPATGIVSGVPSTEGTYTYSIHTDLAPGISAATATCPSGTSTDAAYQVTISCDASCRIATLSPSNLIFASQNAGTTSPAQTVTFSNSGSGVMSISSITTTGDFAQTNTCGSSLASGGSCVINVTFTPTTAGSRTGTLSVNDNAAGSPQTASLSGTGLAPIVNLSSASVVFGAQMLNTSSGYQTVTLTNSGTGPLLISSISVSGDFTQTNTCGSSLAAGASCNINIVFMPIAAGLRTGTLTINDNAPGSPHVIALSGAVLQGYHDVANCDGMAGWAWDSTLPNTPIVVYFFDGARYLGSANADQYRPDLAGTYGMGYHGFSWANDVSLYDGAPHSISVHVAPSANSAMLSNSPRTISCSPALTFSWIQPSNLSWGPANTLTAAGFATGGTGNVALRWRDATLNTPWTSVPYEAPPNSSNGGWSNTIPSSDICHAFQATVTYAGTTVSKDYDGVSQGYCSFRVIWVQPQSTAGFGPPGSLVVAGSAQGGPPNSQVTLWFRDDTLQSGWIPLSYAPIPDTTGIWYNAIENVDFTHQYSVYITYDNRNSGSCSYYGNGGPTTCPAN